MNFGKKNLDLIQICERVDFQGDNFKFDFRYEKDEFLVRRFQMQKKMIFIEKILDMIFTYEKE